MPKIYKPKKKKTQLQNRSDIQVCKSSLCKNVLSDLVMQVSSSCVTQTEPRGLPLVSTVSPGLHFNAAKPWSRLSPFVWVCSLHELIVFYFFCGVGGWALGLLAYGLLVPIWTKIEPGPWQWKLPSSNHWAARTPWSSSFTVWLTAGYFLTWFITGTDLPRGRDASISLGDVIGGVGEPHVSGIV